MYHVTILAIVFDEQDELALAPSLHDAHASRSRVLDNFVQGFLDDSVRVRRRGQTKWAFEAQRLTAAVAWTAGRV